MKKFGLALILLFSMTQNSMANNQMSFDSLVNGISSSIFCHSVLAKIHNGTTSNVKRIGEIFRHFSCDKAKLKCQQALSEIQKENPLHDSYCYMDSEERLLETSTCQVAMVNFYGVTVDDISYTTQRVGKEESLQAACSMATKICEKRLEGKNTRGAFSKYFKAKCRQY